MVSDPLGITKRITDNKFDLFPHSRQNFPGHCTGELSYKTTLAHCLKGLEHNSGTAKWVSKTILAHLPWEVSRTFKIADNFADCEAVSNNYLLVFIHNCDNNLRCRNVLSIHFIMGDRSQVVPMSFVISCRAENRLWKSKKDRHHVIFIEWHPKIGPEKSLAMARD
jgi:hypothetical protein